MTSPEFEPTTSIVRLDRREFAFGAASVAAMSTLAGTAAFGRTVVEIADDEAIYLSASAQLELFRARKLSPVEVLEAQIAQIEARDDAVNCVNDRYFDEAMAAARTSEQAYMSGVARPLEGLTLGVKDEHTIAGKVMTNGSALHDPEPQKKTSIIVERMINAGAIPHARTTTPENSFAMTSWTNLWGVTRNPWNLYYTCGGSSGGSGAALAAGMATLATGSDLAGSVRIPASVNGLYGFKPPRGRVPVLMPGSMQPWWSEGPLARTYEDMVLFQNTISGHDRRDMYSLTEDMTIPADSPGVAGMRIALCVNLGFYDVAPEVEANLRASAKLLEDQGAIIEEVTLPWTAEQCHAAFAYNVFGSTMGVGAASMLEYEDQLTTYLVELAGRATRVTPEQRLEGEPLHAEMHQQLVNAVWAKGHEAMICPTIANEGVRADFDITKHELVINSKQMDPLLDWVMTWPFNALNRYPAVTIPNGRASNNVPTGLQIIGPILQDRTAFRIAQAHARAAPQLFTGDAFPDFRDAA